MPLQIPDFSGEPGREPGPRVTGEIQANRFSQFAGREMLAQHAQLLEHGLGLRPEAAPV